MTATLRTIHVLWRREILRMLSEPSRMLGIVAQPLLFWLVIGSGFVPSFRIAQNEGLDYQAFFFPGIIAMVVLFSAIFSTITIIEDRASGFLQAVLVGPGGRAALVMGKIAGVASIAIFQAALCFVIAPWAGVDFGQINWSLLLASLIGGAVFLGALGFVFAWWTDSSTAYHAVMSMLLIPMWVISGGLFPAASGVIERLVQFNPMGWLVAAIRASLAGGIAPAGTIPAALTATTSLTLIVIFAIAAVACAVWVCEKRR